MKLGFEEAQSHYTSGSQKARVWTERWVSEQLYCPNCGNRHVNQFSANLPLAGFFCASCQEQFELKSQKTKFGNRVVDGAYHTKKARLLSDDNPNLLLLNCDLPASGEHSTNDRRNLTNHRDMTPPSPFTDRTMTRG